MHRVYRICFALFIPLWLTASFRDFKHRHTPVKPYSKRELSVPYDCRAYMSATCKLLLIILHGMHVADVDVNWIHCRCCRGNSSCKKQSFPIKLRANEFMYGNLNYFFSCVALSRIRRACCHIALKVLGSHCCAVDGLVASAQLKWVLSRLNPCC